MRFEYDCFVKNKVSVWCGSFESKKEFLKYTETIYTNRGEAVSSFLDEFHISDFDEDYQEKLYVEQDENLAEQLSRVSYIENFTEEINNDLSKVDTAQLNSFLFIFDMDISFLPANDNTVMKPLGVYDYRK